ncbi:PREDICTED: DNA-directed RNA polymerase II subunit RPB1-like [Rhagoletis zephyria]|uniref:DNA-directed RNA polymerase II subunit RPB1-like n=1 Tax=Rhagoletis zephyria TaxID=28612 RepID=UPI0008118062|nr:PREDICTED: DNA-directed RNA polymerase II subunit RPB1-like [Rhagoletis zephyria]
MLPKNSFVFLFGAVLFVAIAMIKAQPGDPGPAGIRPTWRPTRPTWRPTRPTWRPTRPTWRPTRPTWRPTRVPRDSWNKAKPDW